MKYRFIGISCVGGSCGDQTVAPQDNTRECTTVVAGNVELSQRPLLQDFYNESQTHMVDKFNNCLFKPRSQRTAQNQHTR
jgi:hypothetical protein